MSLSSLVVGDACEAGRLGETLGDAVTRVKPNDVRRWTARLLSVEGIMKRVRLEGVVRIKHRFYPGRHDQNKAVAIVLGDLEDDATRGTIHSSRLATDRAKYAGQRYGVAVRSVP